MCVCVFPCLVFTAPTPPMVWGVTPRPTYPPAHPPTHPPPHLQGGERYIGICVYTYIYVLYTQTTKLYTYYMLHTYTHACIYTYIVDSGYLEYARFQPCGCGQKKNTWNIWGRNIWGRILECINSAKANTVGITMFPYRKHV